MAAPEKPRVTDKKQLEQFRNNIDAMQMQLFGEPLHNFRRRAQKDRAFADMLAKEYKRVNAAVFQLPAHSVLFDYYKGNQAPTLSAVAQIADFCNAAFRFESPITARDLLGRELEFPALRADQNWERYLGTFRCFYFYPDLKLADSGGEIQLHAGLLRLWEENDNELRACLITGIRHDDHLVQLEQMMSQAHKPEFYTAFREFNDELPRYESRMVCYRGGVDTGLRPYLMLRLRRLHETEHDNTAIVMMRRFDKSAQPSYSGGMAAVTLCRSRNITCHAMAMTRDELFMERDGGFIARHLAVGDNEGKGLMVTQDMDENWNRAMLEHMRRLSENRKR